MKNNIIYEGPFAEHIKNHVNLKQAIGYKYSAEAKHLKRFDIFTIEQFPSSKELSKEIVLNWCKRKSYETRSNQRSRASIIRQFANYMASVGAKAYIVPKGYYPKEKQYTPYIYSHLELTQFFKETEICHYSSQAPYRHLIMPLFFKLIYTCGLRLSEARLLKVEDVDLGAGILSINNSKKDNSRLVPMSDSISEKCKIYAEEVHPVSTTNAYFFPALDGKPMTSQNVYKNFRRFLWRAKISHGGRGHGPRTHDFRHVYAIHCLKKWVRQGKDLTIYLPVLKFYMGHDSFQDTAYYLRLKADVFPEITIKLEGKYPEIIPALEGVRDETY